MNNLNQKAFAAIEAVLILFVICILGFTSWFIWHAKQGADDSLSKATKSVVPVEDSKSDQKTYTAKLGKFTMNYPNDWTVERNDSDKASLPPAGEAFVIHSPLGLKLVYTFTKDDNLVHEQQPDFYGCGQQSDCPIYHLINLDEVAIGGSFGDMYLVEYSMRASSAPDTKIQSYGIELYRPSDLQNLPQIGDNRLTNKDYSFDFYGSKTERYHFKVIFPESMNAMSPGSVFSSADVKTAIQILKSVQPQ
jgi:hypothetical protein